RIRVLENHVIRCSRHIIPPLAKASPDSILIIVSNPVDVLTYVAWKLSGFPVNRVLGSGTNLDSSRFRFLIADHLDVNAQDVQVIIAHNVLLRLETISWFCGYTSWAIGYSVANLARTILRDQRKIHPVTVLARGFYGVDGGDVFLSLPALLGRNGVVAVTNVHMTDDESEKLQKSAKTILEMQSQLEL
ncbi:PREDICTED: L-lactate dehydrogenase A-like, partial [Camelina sativa]|uniref:L-lactate dehydrogenase A-like n=1 Tax=Camelina sativa TaxID=90675 RepID=A0ABM1QQT1_CAMSA